MSYRSAAHVVNVLFIAAVFVAPIAYCLSDPAIPVEVGRGVIMLSFLLGAIAIADWYGTGISNSLVGILLTIVFAGIAAFVMAGIASWRSGAGFIDVALFKSYEPWDGHRGLLRAYVVSVGALGLGIISVPRLVLLRLVSGSSLTAP